MGRAKRLYNLLSPSALGILLALWGCGSADEIGGTGQCGGAKDSAACIRITSIKPTYLEKVISNVDVVEDICDVDDPDTPQIEGLVKLRDHQAVLTVTNASLPGVAGVTDPVVTLRDYSVNYVLNSCPTGETCPVLDPLISGQTVTIAPNSSVDLTLPFVQLAKKIEFRDKGGTPNSYPSYTAVYTLEGTDTFDRHVSVQAAAEFTIGDYDNCP